MLENLRAVVDNGFPVAQQGYKEDIAKWGELMRCFSLSGDVLNERNHIEDKQKRRQKPVRIMHYSPHMFSG